ncbi:AP-4 complex subunit mu-1-like isoform X3 [Dermacentor variabilis]|uniref:AP-4 complex subunit mu-1-like isoform X3 n=1 Tax=Dermacentor variabilis TaxID=34621 RepID=UPI003F5BDCC1
MIVHLGVANPKRQVLVHRQYRHDVGARSFQECVDLVLSTNVQSVGPEQCLSFQKLEDVSIYHICRENIYYLLCSMRSTGDTLAADVTATEFLNELYMLIKNFCGTTTEESLRKNALLIEEILSEIVNRGHIYTTDLSSLRPCIYSEPAGTPILKKTVLTSTLLALVSTQPQTETLLFDQCFIFKTTLLCLQDTKSAVPNTSALRPVFGSRLEQSQNQHKAEIFLDVVEKVYASISTEGSVTNFLLCGSVNLKSCLESKASIILGFNEDLVLASAPSESESYSTDVVLSNYILHDTVKSDKFSVDRTLTVLAPQGEVPVLRYCTTRPNNGYPFSIVAAVEEVPSSRDLVLTVKLRCEGNAGSEAVGTTLEIPLPCNTSGVMKRFNELEQSAEFQYETKKIVWRIKCLKAKSEAVAKFRLANANEGGFGKLELGPISMKFELSNQSTSGLKIRFLKADQHSGSNVQRWIRYVTTSDCWVQRLA